MTKPANWLKSSVSLTREILVAQWLPFLILWAISCGLNIVGEDIIAGLSTDQENLRLFLQLGLGIWDLIEGILLFFILSYGIPKVRKPQADDVLGQPFTTPYVGSFLAEYLRLLAQTLMWGLLLIIPGFFRYCQLTFVPYVALFSKTYRDGNADALRLSERLAKGRMIWILLATILTIAVQFGLEYLPEASSQLHTLSIRIGTDLLSSLIGVLSYSLIFLLFEHALNSVPSEE